MTYDSTELGNGTLLVGNDIYFDPHADAQVDYETSLFRDTLRLYNFWGDESVGIAVSVMEASVTDSPRFLRCDFTSRWFINELEAHVKEYNLAACITEIILDYMWMPDTWALTNYGKHKFGLLKNILELTKRTFPLTHIKAGGIVYLPIPWQLYHGIVMSQYWEELKELYCIEYIHYNDAQLNPLVRSDVVIKDMIESCGKSVDFNLKLMKNQGEKNESLITGDVDHWGGKDDIFMKLTRKSPDTAIVN